MPVFAFGYEDVAVVLSYQDVSFAVRIESLACSSPLIVTIQDHKIEVTEVFLQPLKRGGASPSILTRPGADCFGQACIMSFRPCVDGGTGSGFAVTEIPTPTAIVTGDCRIVFAKFAVRLKFSLTHLRIGKGDMD